MSIIVSILDNKSHKIRTTQGVFLVQLKSIKCSSSTTTFGLGFCDRLGCIFQTTRLYIINYVFYYIDQFDNDLLTTYSFLQIFPLSKSFYLKTIFNFEN